VRFSIFYPSILIIFLIYCNVNKWSDWDRSHEIDRDVLIVEMVPVPSYTHSWVYKNCDSRVKRHPDFSLRRFYSRIVTSVMLRDEGAFHLWHKLTQVPFYLYYSLNAKKDRRILMLTCVTKWKASTIWMTQIFPREDRVMCRNFHRPVWSN